MLTLGCEVQLCKLSSQESQERYLHHPWLFILKIGEVELYGKCYLSMNLNNLNIKTIFYKTFRVNALTCHFIISNHSIRSCNWSCKILPPYIYNNFLILVTCGTRVCHDVTSEYISVHKQQRQITLTLESGGLFDFAEMINLTYNLFLFFCSCHLALKNSLDSIFYFSLESHSATCLDITL